MLIFALRDIGQIEMIRISANIYLKISYAFLAILWVRRYSFRDHVHFPTTRYEIWNAIKLKQCTVCSQSAFANHTDMFYVSETKWNHINQFN